jgi:uncharacterized protein (TIGR04551 family)
MMVRAWQFLGPTCLVLVGLVIAAGGCARFHPAPPPGAPADATYVEVDGVRLHYRALGDPATPTVVLIHGYSASLDTWRGVQDVLATHFRVIAFDLAGFGWSGRPDIDYSPVAEGRLVWRALDRLGVGDVALVGHSWGSSVVLSMTIEQPRRVRRVALYSAYAFEDQVPSFFHWARLGGIGEALFALWYRERAEDRVALAYHNDRYVTQARVEHVEAELGRPGTVAAALAAARRQDFRVLETQWASIAQPVLLLWGDDDQVTPLRFGQRLARELPDAELKVYPACGHIPMVEARLPTTRDLAAFLDRDLGRDVGRDLARDVGQGGSQAIAPVPPPEPVATLQGVPDVPLHAAADVALLGAELAPRKFAAPRGASDLDVSGALRLRGESIYNGDLDRGLDPSGAPAFPVPLDGGQRVDTADLRFRSDLAFYARGTGVAVKMRVDVLDNVALGSTPVVGTGRAPTPSASPGQESPLDVVRVERVWGEVLTPFGIVAAGRMGAHWGLGMVANGGDCEDCDGGDAADRLALVTPVVGHLVALSYDFSWSGPVTARKDDARAVDLAGTDDVATVTAAILRTRTPAALLRRAAAGRSTLEYGAYVSHRWQDDDVPAAYLPVAVPVDLDASQLMARGFRATTTGAWVRVLMPSVRIEAEGVYATARIEQPSLVPGVELTQAATSDQVGLAVETEARVGRLRLGVDAGFASGDDAPGFGAFPTPNAPAAQPGDLDGPQADPPGDTTVDNFRFHPDYRIDRILFHEIIGTVTDAAYVRPHVAMRLADLGHAWLDASVAVIASWAMEPTSTPSGARALGYEIDPSLAYVTRDGFRAALEHAVFVPGAAFDSADGSARAAQLVRVRLAYVF